MTRADLGEMLEEAEHRHGLRLAESGFQLLAAPLLARRPFDPGLPLIILPADPTDSEAPLAATGSDPGASGPAFEPPLLPGRAAHGAGPAAQLRALYPGSHPVLGLGRDADLTVTELTDEHLAAAPRLLPALHGELNLASPHGLPWLVARLRAPDGCPWDREQTHASLRKFLLEEAYEVYDALDDGATPQLAEELGDLLLQVVLHAHYAAEAEVFDLSDVYRQVMTKIVRRHPHVFGDVEARSVDQVLRNWERIKAGERAAANGSAANASDPEMPTAFAGLSRSLPALAYSQEMQERAASLGYDWPDTAGILDKIQEELDELMAASDHTSRTEEFGDLLLVAVNLGRRLGIDAEQALRRASAKFARRFARVERLAEEQGLSLGDLDAAGLDALWRSAKVGETSA